MKEDDKCYDFGPFRLDALERQLLRDRTPVSLTGKAFDTLLALVERSGHLVGKAELFKIVWKDSFVEEGNLAVTISMLRKALDDNRSSPKYIQTISKCGYRFVGDVQNGAVPTAPLSPIYTRRSTQSTLNATLQNIG